MSTDKPFITPPFTEEMSGRLLSLNNLHAEELSYQTPQAFGDLLKAASHVRATADGLALIVAFDEGCTYNNPNFFWLKARYRRFNYIDRVVVSEKARGRGLARMLYSALEEQTRADGRERLVCEINSVPPNPASDAFHVALGFHPVGEQVLAERGKTVRYWAKELN